MRARMHRNIPAHPIAVKSISFIAHVNCLSQTYRNLVYTCKLFLVFLPQFFVDMAKAVMDFMLATFETVVFLDGGDLPIPVRLHTDGPTVHPHVSEVDQ